MNANESDTIMIDSATVKLREISREEFFGKK
jgi:hypothetical protein